MPVSLLRSAEVVAYKLKNRLVNFFDPPVVILLYHRVTTLLSDSQQLAVSPGNFREHLQYLKNNFPVVRLEEDWSKVKKPAVVITFDDGYADNAREALPIIEEIGVPATFFVSTGTIGTQLEFWWDELEHLIMGNHSFPERFELADSGNKKVWPTVTIDERRVLFEELQPLMQNADAQCRESRLRQLRQWAQVDGKACEFYRVMTVEELQRLAGSGLVTIGAHTITHAKLSCLAVEEQHQEIIGSKKQLESWLGREVTVFSYPFGTREDYTRKTVDICREAGFVKTAANFPAQVHSWTDLYQVPRQLVRNWPVGVFAKKLKGFWIS